MNIKKFVMKYDTYIVFCGLMFALIGVSLGITANLRNRNIQMHEREISDDGIDKDEYLYLLDQRIINSTIGFSGFVLTAIGFILSSLIHISVKYMKSGHL
jgi:hypothetical protein